MQASLLERGVESRLIRGSSEVFIKEGVPTLQTTIHPTSEEILSKMLEQYKVAPALIPFVDHTRLMHNRGTISLEIAITRESAGSLPECTNGEDGQNFFHVENLPLNEFGYYYVALFIAGNYARYYPDLWIEDIKANSDLFFFLEILTEEATNRLAVLTLMELNRKLYIFK